MVFTTFASDLLSCLLHLCSLVNLSKSIFSSSVGFVIESRAVRRTIKKNNKTSKLNKMGEFHEWRNVEAISHQTMPYAPSPI